MYLAKHFEIPAERLANYLARVQAGNLITVHPDGPKASFVPFHLEDRGDHQVLVTHLVRNNEQAVEPITGPALIIIDLGDAYISPLWYPTNKALPNVPTWDYLNIQIDGPVKILTDPAEALRAAAALTGHFEKPEVLEAVGDTKLNKMAKAIVGVEVRVERVRGKAKASQNRHPDDIRGIIEHLEPMGVPELVAYLKEVALPYAENRFGMIADIRVSRSTPGCLAD